MFVLKTIVILLSVVWVVPDHNVAKRWWFGKKKSTIPPPTSKISTPTTTEKPPKVIPISEIPNFDFPINPIDIIVSELLTAANETLRLEPTTEAPIATTTAKTGFMNFVRTGFKDIPILNVLQDTLVKTVDNVVDLPENLVNGIKTGNPLNIVKTAVKVLPLVDEDVVDKGFDILQDQIVNLPGTMVEGVKQGVNFLNNTIGGTGSVLKNVVDPVSSLVGLGLDKTVDLLNMTGHVVGKVVKPVGDLAVNVLNTTFTGTGGIVGDVTDTASDTVSALSPATLISSLLSTLGLPLFIIIAIVVIAATIACLACCVVGVCRCLKNKEKKSYPPYTPGKNSNAEDAQKLLP
ncbi:hypothetical protein RN001_014684 [Aquatica leii]|uniref:Uncharacterized protein n=1 Tax=Aquatica leii TaxID=1421715 RepID=A0AAN7SN85_9COLE|nr:hypothetical protein RN001_014684 [Aquatica leii]